MIYKYLKNAFPLEGGNYVMCIMTFFAISHEGLKTEIPKLSISKTRPTSNRSIEGWYEYEPHKLLFRAPPLCLSAKALHLVAMLLSVSSLISKPFSSPFITTHRSKLSIKTQTQTQVNVNLVTKTRCELNLNEQPSSSSSPSSNYSEKGRNKEASSSSKLGIGSPVIITEAPKMIKTAASVPCLRVNADLVKPGDVGRWLFNNQLASPFFFLIWIITL